MFLVEKHVKYEFPKFLPEIDVDFYRYAELSENSKIFILEFNVKLSDRVNYGRMMYYQIEDMLCKISKLTNFSLYILKSGTPLTLGNIELEEIYKILKDATGKYLIFCHNHKSRITCSEYFSFDFDTVFQGTEVIFNKYQP